MLISLLGIFRHMFFSRYVVSQIVGETRWNAGYQLVMDEASHLEGMQLILQAASF